MRYGSSAVGFTSTPRTETHALEAAIDSPMHPTPAWNSTTDAPFGTHCCIRDKQISIAPKFTCTFATNRHEKLREVWELMRLCGSRLRPIEGVSRNAIWRNTDVFPPGKMEVTIRKSYRHKARKGFGVAPDQGSVRPERSFPG